MKFKIGSKVRLTGQYLHQQRRFADPEGLKVWMVLGFERDWAIVDELIDSGLYTTEELAADPLLAFRRICVSILCGEREITHRNCPVTTGEDTRKGGLLGVA